MTPSTLTFLSRVEILSIPIRNQENNYRNNYRWFKTKLLLFADDTTAVLSDLDSARALFILLERLEKASEKKIE